MLRILVGCYLFFFNYAVAICPADKSTFSMVFPAKFIFISEDNSLKEPQRIPGIIIEAILNEFKSESPKIIFVGTSKTFSLVKKKVAKIFAAGLVSDKLVLYETSPALFQQDVFESFYDKANKTIILRQFRGYIPKNKGPDMQKISSILATENINVKMGNTLDQLGAWLTGVGGNVESTAFGFNLLGSGEFTEQNLRLFATDLFSDLKHTLFFDTSWLALGHIDEVLVEIKSQSNSKGCESTFLINSPQLGFKFDKIKSKKELNQELQKRIDGFKNQLVNAARGLCKINFVEVPIVYKNSPEHNNRKVFAAEYPLLTNGLLIKDRYFVVEVIHQEIREYFTESLKKIGIKVVWLPLGDLYHGGIVDGYMHCLTNSIRACDSI